MVKLFTTFITVIWFTLWQKSVCKINPDFWFYRRAIVMNAEFEYFSIRGIWAVSTKIVVPHCFNTCANLNYVGQIQDISLYGVDRMSTSERQEFVLSYDKEKDSVWQQTCSRRDVTVLREACTICRCEFIEIGNIEVFLEAFTIASACNKVLRKKFLTPYTIGLIPAGWYSCNEN